MSTSADIFISSSCGPEAIDCVFSPPCGAPRKLGLELGCSPSRGDVDSLIARAAKQDIPLLAHNYFYPHNETLVVNLSDPDPVKRRISLDYAVAMIDYCAHNNIAAYSIHAGFACSFSLDHFSRRIALLPPIPLQDAYDFFVANLRILAEQAARHKIALLFENNVLTHENLLEGSNRHLLCVTSEDILYVLNRVGREDVQVLLDLGHLKVSAATLGLSAMDEARRLARFVGQVHIHDNDGEEDLHGPASRQSWFWRMPLPCGIPFTIEQPDEGRDAIMSQITLLQEMRRTDA